MIRKWIPEQVRLRIRVWQRTWNDWKTRRKYPLSTERGTVSGKVQLTVAQEIKSSATFDNKVHNLKLAAVALEQVVIGPGEVFSFWKIIGNPSAARGYRKGRNIVGGKLQEAVGGGLCQLSGIVYHAALRAGLETVERYNHTVDIYKEEDRFTPLGSDATVVYGYKDLRMRNTLSVPMQFVCEFSENEIACGIRASVILKARELHFDRHDSEQKREVYTMDSTTGECVAVSTYKLPL